MDTVYITITNHGFGHAARTGSILSELGQLPTPPRLIVNSTVPREVLESFISVPFELRRRPLDTGVIQSDSLGMDLEATLRELSVFRQNQDEILREELQFLEQEQVRLILGDIPPYAAEVGARAGVPCWMMSNFGWDFVYRDFGPEFQTYADAASAYYDKCELLFRMPFHEPMRSFPLTEDVGVTGRPSSLSPAEARAGLNQELHEPIPQDEIPLVMIIFGGMGLDNVPWENLRRFNGHDLPARRFLTYAADAPDVPNLYSIPRGMKASDVLPLCERVISKPGYGIMADVYQAQIGIITMSRPGFAETPVLEEALRNHFRHRLLDPEQFFSDDWSFIVEPLNDPRGTDAPARNGNEQIVNRIREFLEAPHA